MYIDLFLWSGEQNQAKCLAKIWVPILGFGFLMGPMLAKTCTFFFVTFSPYLEDF